MELKCHFININKYNLLGLRVGENVGSKVIGVGASVGETVG